MNSNVSDFFLELAKNPELLEKFKGKSLDECYEMAVKDGKWNFTKEEFIIILKKLIEQENLISDEKLGDVSGGLFANIGNDIKRFVGNVGRDYSTIFRKEKTAEQYETLFGDAVGLIGDAGYLYGAITKFKNKIDEDNINYLKKQQEVLNQVISEEKAKKTKNVRKSK